jgi:hypothetical protein
MPNTGYDGDAEGDSRPQLPVTHQGGRDGIERVEAAHKYEFP